MDSARQVSRFLLTFIEPQGTHMVSINQPRPPFQADRPDSLYVGCTCHVIRHVMPFNSNNKARQVW
jgi:hypothetical protein